MYTHFEILPVLASIRWKFEICKLNYNTSSTKFELPYLLVLLSFTSFLLYSTQFDQRGYLFRDGMQVNLHVRSSK